MVPALNFFISKINIKDHTVHTKMSTKLKATEWRPNHAIQYAPLFKLPPQMAEVSSSSVKTPNGASFSLSQSDFAIHSRVPNRNLLKLEK
jgi:hypothetical protein